MGRLRFQDFKLWDPEGFIFNIRRYKLKSSLLLLRLHLNGGFFCTGSKSREGEIHWIIQTQTKARGRCSSSHRGLSLTHNSCTTSQTVRVLYCSLFSDLTVWDQTCSMFGKVVESVFHQVFIFTKLYRANRRNINNIFCAALSQILPSLWITVKNYSSNKIFCTEGRNALVDKSDMRYMTEASRKEQQAIWFWF